MRRFGLIAFHVFIRREPFSESIRDGASVETVLRAIVERDLRPYFPQSVPALVRELAGDCWHRNPVKRPSFAEVQDTLAAAVEVRSFLMRFIARRDRAAQPLFSLCAVAACGCSVLS